MLNLNFGGTQLEDSHFPTFTSLPEDIRELLEVYSNIPPNKVIPHIEEVRHAALFKYSYPMITQLRFLRLSLSQHPSYSRVLSLLDVSGSSSPPNLLLDIGPGLGQDIRKLIYDGVATTSIVGLELDPGLLEIGFDLFQDRQTLNVPFVIGDLLVFGSKSTDTNLNNATNNDSSTTPDLRRKFTIINASSLLHLFPLPLQHRLVQAMIELLLPQPGSRILGWQLGNPTPMDYFDMTNFTLQYRHDKDSFREFWADIGRDTGTSWLVDVCEMEWRDETAFGEPGMWALSWEVVRL